MSFSHLGWLVGCLEAVALQAKIRSSTKALRFVGLSPFGRCEPHVVSRIVGTLSGWVSAPKLVGQAQGRDGDETGGLGLSSPAAEGQQAMSVFQPPHPLDPLR